MLVTIYEVMRRQHTDRRISIHLLTDYTYWFHESSEQEVSLLVCTERMLLSDALQWQHGRARECNVQASHKSHTWRHVTRNDWEEYVAEQSLAWRTEHYAEDGCAAHDSPSIYRTSGAIITEETLSKLAGQLVGRRLLVEEVRQLCLDVDGLELGALEWIDEHQALLALIQKLVLREAVQLNSGMSAQVGGSRDGLHVIRRWLNPLNNSGHKHARLRCSRCDSGSDKHYKSHCAVCGRECVYCEACLQMGRVRECSILVSGRNAGEQQGGDRHGHQSGEHRSPHDSHHQGGEYLRQQSGGMRKPQLDAKHSRHSEHSRHSQQAERAEYLDIFQKWNLSPAQQAASYEALAFIRQPAKREGEQFLIWAVTGAGKTEMVYPLVEDVLQRGGRVLLTAPRRDVVLELAPRLQRAFPDNAVVALYGGSEQRWQLGEITISTTHQLLRLERCFDLVVLDELDAFPYHNNPMLAFAARRACKTRGKTVLLTATPPREQQLRMRQRKYRLPHAMVPVRFHRHPLPVPRILRFRGLAHTLGTGVLPSKLRAALDESLQRGAQIFVFVPRIEHVLPLTRLLRKACACAVDAAAVDGTSSRDTERAEKVRRFRSCDIRILVTTTILERGVTIPRSDVYILDADASLFDEAALVQMAGRAGRSADDPCGRVYYCARERTDGTVSAVRQIRAMNRLARQRGLLLENEKGTLRGKGGGD